MRNRKIFNESNSDESNMTLLLPSPLDLVSFENEYRILSNELYKTPFDRYHFTAFVFVIDPATNLSVPILNLNVSNTGRGDFITTFETGTSRSNFIFEPPTQNTPVVVTVPTYRAYATVRRADRAQVITGYMFIINWMMTLSLVIFTAIVVSARIAGEGLALVPITTVLSVPAIRSLYVGMPPYGILLGTHRNSTTPLEGLTTLLRHGGVLPTNDNRDGVWHDGHVTFHKT